MNDSDTWLKSANILLINLTENIRMCGELIKVLYEAEEPLPPDLLRILYDSLPSHMTRSHGLENVVPQFTASGFESNFRMTPTTFEFLLKELRSTGVYNILHNKGGRTQICMEKSVMTGLWILSTAECYRAVGERFKLTKSSVHKCLKDFISALLMVRKDTICFPTDLHAVEKSFQAIAGLPKVVGVIDGCHVSIKQPKENSMDFYNHKQFFSVSLQAVCDPDMFFTDIDVRCPGSIYDTRVLTFSDLYKFAPSLCDEGYCIIGDPGYPVLPWLIPAFKNEDCLTDKQVKFNKALSKTHVVIDRAFALLKGRFRRLQYLDMKHINDIHRTIMACCTLHNICLKHNKDVDVYIQEGKNHVHKIHENYVDKEVDEDGLAKREDMLKAIM